MPFRDLTNLLMTIQQIRYCLGVADCGSFNRASEKLYISQPSLTSSVHDLEAELGFEIFKRTSRGTSLTERGSEFLLDARQLFQNYEALLNKYTGQEKKSFSVSALYYAFARKAFVQVVKEFSDMDYDFSFWEKRALNVIEDVAAGNSDIGLLYLSERNREDILKRLAANSLVFTPLTECGAFVYLHKNHPLTRKKWISLEDLKPYHFVTFDTDDVKSFFSDEIIKSFGLDQPITVADRATELNLIKNLNGYTFLSGASEEQAREDESEDFLTIPLQSLHDSDSTSFSLGYIIKKDSKIGKPADHYISAVKKILGIK